MVQIAGLKKQAEWSDAADRAELLREVREYFTSHHAELEKKGWDRASDHVQKVFAALAVHRATLDKMLLQCKQGDEIAGECQSGGCACARLACRVLLTDCSVCVLADPVCSREKLIHSQRQTPMAQMNRL